LRPFAVTDALALEREVILFESAGVGRSTGEVPASALGMAAHEIAAAQIAAFREWEQCSGRRFADLRSIRQPTLVVNGVHDEMIPIVNSYRLAENLPNAVLFTYPDSGHGSLFQFHESFTRQAAAFLASNSAVAPY